MVASTAAAGSRTLQQIVAPNTSWQHAQQLRCFTTAAALAPRAAAAVAATTEHTSALELTAAGPAPVAAYVHLPFCKRKCFYCDFPVEAVGLNVNKTSERSSWRLCVVPSLSRLPKPRPSWLGCSCSREAHMPTSSVLPHTQGRKTGWLHMSTLCALRYAPPRGWDSSPCRQSPLAVE